MKFIKKLIINNFQSHKYSELDFGQDLNVIIDQHGEILKIQHGELV